MNEAVGQKHQISINRTCYHFKTSSRYSSVRIGLHPQTLCDRRSPHIGLVCPHKYGYQLARISGAARDSLEVGTRGASLPQQDEQISGETHGVDNKPEPQPSRPEFTFLSPIGDPATTYLWPSLRPFSHRPPFLRHYTTNKGQGPVYTVTSFLGIPDGCKLLVPRSDYHSHFLPSCLAALGGGYLLFLAERCEARQPHRHFVDLGLPWSMPPHLLARLLPPLVEVVVGHVQAAFSLPHPPRMLVSMRTPWRVRLSFPNVLTTRVAAEAARAEMVEAARTQLPRTLWESESSDDRGEGSEVGSEQGNKSEGSEVDWELDWERVFGHPHHNVRMLGSRLTNRMVVEDLEPAWVVERAYFPVDLRPGGQWAMKLLTLQTLQDTSIQPTLAQLQEFEATQMPELAQVSESAPEPHGKPHGSGPRPSPAAAGALIRPHTQHPPPPPPPPTTTPSQPQAGHTPAKAQGQGGEGQGGEGQGGEGQGGEGQGGSPPQGSSQSPLPTDPAAVAEAEAAGGRQHKLETLQEQGGGAVGGGDAVGALLGAGSGEAAAGGRKEGL